MARCVASSVTATLLTILDRSVQVVMARPGMRPHRRASVHCVPGPSLGALRGVERWRPGGNARELVTRCGPAAAESCLGPGRRPHAARDPGRPAGRRISCSLSSRPSMARTIAARPSASPASRARPRSRPWPSSAWTSCARTASSSSSRRRPLSEAQELCPGPALRAAADRGLLLGRPGRPATRGHGRALHLVRGPGELPVRVRLSDGRRHPRGPPHPGRRRLYRHRRSSPARRPPPPTTRWSASTARSAAASRCRSPARTS